MRYLFPMLLFLVAVVAGAIEIIAGARQTSHEPLPGGGWRRVVSLSWNWLPALWVLIFQIPHVTHVFLSLMARYH